MRLEFCASRNLLRMSCLIGTALSTPAMAQEADTAAASAAAPEIIVTARRVEERLQDVPVSITVFNQEELTQRNVAIAADLATYTPSLSVNQRYGPEKASFSIRGFNQANNTAPTVGLYFAEVVGVRAQGSTTGGNTVGAGAFTDLANVQVLKGPQGTLFGRNTTGGAILLTPQKPTDRLEGYLEGTYGNFDQVRLTGALNIPLADTFKVRLTGERNKRDGYMKNHALVGAEDFNDVDYAYGRLSIVGNLTPDLENYIVVHYSNSDTHGYASRINTCIKDVADGGSLVTTPGATGYSGSLLLQTLSCREQLARQKARSDGPYDVENNLLNPQTKSEQWQIINTTTWNASDSVTLKNIVSYGEFRERLNIAYLSTNFTVPDWNGEGGFNLTTFLNPAITNSDGSDYIIPAGTPYKLYNTDGGGPNTYSAAQSSVTEELQLHYASDDDRFDAVIGGYLEFSRSIGYNSTISGNFLDCTSAEDLDCANPLTFGSFSERRSKYNFDNHGIYGQGTFDITERLAVTAGARWTFDSIDAYGQNTRFRYSTASGSYVDPRTGASILRTCEDTVTYPGPTVVDSPVDCTTRKTNKSDKPTWVVDLEYKAIDDLMLYGKYSRGYRQGGINFSSVGFETWGPESMDTFEIGAKTSFRGAVSGYFNAAAFYNKLYDQQILAQLIPTEAAVQQGVTGASAILNAGKARSYGLELDGSVVLFDSLRLNGSYAYIDTKIVEVPSSDDLAPRLVGTAFQTINPQVAVGTGFLDTPKHKFSLGANYTLPLDPAMGDLTVGAIWSYSSKVVTNYSDPAYVDGFPVGVTPGHSMLNLNADWESVGGSPVDVSLFVTNLTKELVKIPNQFPYAFSGGAVHVGYLPPRMYGLRLRYNFGR